MTKVIALRSAERHPAPSDHCEQCPSVNMCWPALSPTLAQLRIARRRVKRGQTLYRMGEGFHALYSVRSGTFKTRALLEDGRDQVMGFHLSGEMLGFDGIDPKCYQTDCVALEDSEVCVLPYDQVLTLSRNQPNLMAELLRAMSREIVREQNLMALLGSMQADERLVHFLLALSARMHTRGFSAACFILRMTREEIGSYLGLKLETVSRIFSRLHAAGLIEVRGNRQITLLDPAALKNFSPQTLDKPAKTKSAHEGRRPRVALAKGPAAALVARRAGAHAIAMPH